jgi:hypothetical protein
MRAVSSTTCPTSHSDTNDPHITDLLVRSGIFTPVSEEDLRYWTFEVYLQPSQPYAANLIDASW